MEQKLNAREKTAMDYGLDSNSITRYLRINKLIDAHKTRLDDGELALRAAVTLSYLSPDEQQILNDVLDSSHYRVDMKKADALRLASDKKTLTHNDVEQILAGTKKPKATRSAPFKLKPKIVTKYFKPEQKPDEIEATIIEALDFYYAHRNQEGGPISDGGNEIISADVAAGEALPLEIANG
jgi:ParB family chromosome partitioning protein